MDSPKELDIRPSPIAGTWYPGNEVALRRELASYLDPDIGAMRSSVSGEVLGLIVPHAGYCYSGKTAMAAFQAIQGQSYQKVIVISPSHRGYSGTLLTSGHEAYETPLGIVPLDREALLILNEQLELHNRRLQAVRFDQEHSLEIELPFLQYLLQSPFKLIPIMMLDQGQNTMLALAKALFALIQSFGKEEEVLIVGSSDLSHFYPQQKARKLDEAFIKALETGDAKMLYQAAGAGRAEACGLGPCATVLTLCQLLGAEQISIADYRDSSHFSGDTNSVVGYVSAIISRKDKNHV